MRDYAAISKRLRRYSENYVAYKLDADFADAVSDAADAIEELLDELTTIRKQLPHWISVEERLPEQKGSEARGTYLVHLASGCIKTLFYEYPFKDINRLFPEGWHQTGSPVTHWMPLPAPPKVK